MHLHMYMCMYIRECQMFMYMYLSFVYNYTHRQNEAQHMTAHTHTCSLRSLPVVICFFYPFSSSFHPLSLIISHFIVIQTLVTRPQKTLHFSTDSNASYLSLKEEHQEVTQGLKASTIIVMQDRTNE